MIKTTWLFYKFLLHDETIKMLPSKMKREFFTLINSIWFHIKIIEERFINVYTVFSSKACFGDDSFIGIQ